MTVVEKAIDRDPARRYPSAGALADDLQRFLDDEPVQARRQSQVERYVRWARHNPGIATLGGVLATVLVLATAASLSPNAQRRYQDIVADGLDGDSHRHIYAANLGVRAHAYLAVGGFPHDSVGEEHGLWQRLRAAGYPLTSPTAIRVRTSARTRGRATGGLAELLRTLHDTFGADSMTPVDDTQPNATTTGTR